MTCHTCLKCIQLEKFNNTDITIIKFYLNINTKANAVCVSEGGR